MKNEDFRKYFLQKIPLEVYQAIIKLCDRFLEKKRSLSHEQHIIAFSILQQFLDEHNIDYSLPKTLSYYGNSNYQIDNAIVEFFRTTKYNIQSLPLNEQSQLRKQHIRSHWKWKQTVEQSQETESLSRNDLLLLIKEKDNLISLLIKQIEKALQSPSFYTHVEGDNQMTNNPGGISIGGNVGGNLNNVQGDNNQVNQGDNNQINSTKGSVTQEQLTKDDVVKLLAELAKLLQETELSEDLKEEASMYLSAAKKATEKEQPKKTTALANLETMAETIETASKTMDAGKTFWSKAKPIISKVAFWLGAAAGSYLGSL